jgi:Spy/CpxP family protein refolding chaperone
MSLFRKTLRPVLLGVALSVVSTIALGQHGQRNPMKGLGKPKGINAAGAQRPQPPRAAQNPQRGNQQGGRQQPGRPNPNATPQQKIRQEIMRQIDLKPEQQAQIRQISQSHDDEIRAAGRRVRQARLALDRSLMSEQFNEGEVNRLAEEFAAARADQIKMEARVRTEVRKVLTNEQIQKFNQLQQQIRQRQQQIRQQKMQEEQQQQNTPPESSATLLPGEEEIPALATLDPNNNLNLDLIMLLPRP